MLLIIDAIQLRIYCESGAELDDGMYLKFLNVTVRTKYPSMVKSSPSIHGYVQHLLEKIKTEATRYIDREIPL